ncbi:MAG: sodium/pantothenate symporter [Synergistaceae bacterium]|nr:sodium/pantothenate symporter [Synergistaceae bacterium]
MINFSLFVPIILYFLLLIVITCYANKKARLAYNKGSFMEEYFVGSRSMGGIVLAMTIVATYTSASSFVGGPGVAYKLGLGWILLSMIQVPTVFLTIGILGKKFARVACCTNCMTFTDFLRARYSSPFVDILSSIAILIFFVASMVAQFVGGARLFEALTGNSYFIGLLIFGISVVLYTTFGGFRAVVLTDTLQGAVMAIASFVILYCTIKTGGGLEHIMKHLATIDPGLITPTGANNAIPKPFIMSFWVLVGIAILGLPQTTQKCLGYKDAKAMHDAMIIGTIVCGFTILAMHMVGALGRAVVPGIEVGDMAIPTIVRSVMSPFWAGVFIAGPLAAIMSTVDSMLIMCSATIVKDLYFHYVLKEDWAKISSKKIKNFSTITTAIIGLIVFAFAITPPDLLVWINLFAFGGLEAVFFCPTIFGLYWKRANSSGAICSMLAGASAFFYFNISGVSFYGTTPIVPSLAIAIIVFVLASFLGKKEPDKILEIFDF